MGAGERGRGRRGRRRVGHSHRRGGRRAGVTVSNITIPVRDVGPDADTAEKGRHCFKVGLIFLIFGLPCCIAGAILRKCVAKDYKVEMFAYNAAINQFEWVLYTDGGFQSQNAALRSNPALQMMLQQQQQGQIPLEQIQANYNIALSGQAAMFNPAMGGVNMGMGGQNMGTGGQNMGTSPFGAPSGQFQQNLYGMEGSGQFNQTSVAFAE